MHTTPLGFPATLESLVEEPGGAFVQIVAKPRGSATAGRTGGSVPISIPGQGIEITVADDPPVRSALLRSTGVAFHVREGSIGVRLATPGFVEQRGDTTLRMQAVAGTGVAEPFPEAPDRPVAMSPDHHDILVADDAGWPALFHALANMGPARRCRQRVVIALSAAAPFRITPASVVWPGKREHADSIATTLAAPRLCDDWGVAARIASACEQPGCFSGSLVDAIASLGGEIDNQIVRGFLRSDSAQALSQMIRAAGSPAPAARWRVFEVTAQGIHMRLQHSPPDGFQQARAERAPSAMTTPDRHRSS